MQKVFHIKQTEDIKYITRPDLYEYSPNKRLKWLQRTCFWILNKLHCNHIDRVVAYKAQRVDTDRFMHQLLEAKADFIRRLEDNPSTVLMGAEQYDDLIKADDRLTQPLGFTSQYDYHDGHTLKIMGLKVIVIPWMDGMVLVPNSYLTLN